MKYSEIKKIVKIGDLIIIAATLIICLVWFTGSHINHSDLTATVYSNGKIVFQAALSSLSQEKTVTADGCVITVTKNGACFSHSNCPDGLCVRRGQLTKSGDAMACVPNKVTLVISSDDSRIDSVAY